MAKASPHRYCCNYPTLCRQMLIKLNRHILSALMILLLAVATAGCRHTDDVTDSIYSCGEFTIYADSIVSRSAIYRAVSPTQISGLPAIAADSTGAAVSYRSEQSMADALFAKALSPTATPATPEEIYLSLGLLHPEEAMGVLRKWAGTKINDNDGFPYSALCPYWGAAAWEIYCATGSKTWLREAYTTLTSMLNRQWHLNSSPLAEELKCGMARRDPATDIFYPGWMDEMDRFETFGTAVNIHRAASLRIASQMAAELRLYAERELLSESEKLAAAINDQLWLPDMERYGQYLYGRHYPIVSTVTDYEADMLAVLSGIATDEMAAAMVAALPVIAGGIPTVYPYINPATPLSPTVGTLYGLAASQVHNPRAFIHAMASLWNLTLHNDLPAHWPALVLKGLFGIRMTPEAMELRPMVPEIFTGVKRIEGLRYREAILDIELHGTGDRIASFMIDSINSTVHAIDAATEGRHQVTITLSGNDINSKPLRIVEPVTVPPVPDIKWPTQTDMKIADFDKLTNYGIYLNGVLEETITTDNYHLHPGKEPVVVDIVPTTDGNISGFSPAAHIYAPEGTLVTIHASSITPRRPPRHFIKDPATATNYIELAARHNTRITCYVNVPSAGDYFLTVGYSNGWDRCALRTLSVNDRDTDVLLFPARQPNDWVKVFPSTTAVVTLEEGVNKLALTYIRGTILLNKISLLKKQ
ncbi:MAG: hypothetical protein NC212_06070 [Staphylococcus sp.]|nr:hypothetical protein [Staphylococcus sp.]